MHQQRRALSFVNYVGKALPQILPLEKKILTSHTFKLQLQMSEEIMKMFCINVYLWSSAALCKYPV